MFRTNLIGYVNLHRIVGDAQLNRYFLKGLRERATWNAWV